MASQLRALSLRTTGIQQRCTSALLFATPPSQHTSVHTRLLLQQQCHRLSHSAPPSKPRAKKKDKELDKLAPALQAFYHVYGHFAVPHHFQIPTVDAAEVSGGDDSRVPSSDQLRDDSQSDNTATTLHQWPEELRGLKLDALVMRLCREVSKHKATRKPARQALAQASTKATLTEDEIESKADVKAVRKQLSDIGFPVKRVADVEHGWPKFRWQEGVLEPLKVFKDLYGHLLVPQEFVVPTNNEKWPRCAWGSKLGSKAHYLRVYNLDHHQKSQLNAIGFIWDGYTAQREMWSRFFMPALRRYKEIHGHCSVPEGFVIPTREEQPEEDEWPDSLRGFILGAVVHATRLGKYGRNVVESFDELKELGFLGEKPTSSPTGFCIR